MSTASNVWKRLNEGAMGYVFYIVLGMLAALAVSNILGLTLGTNIPLVAVLSGSMDHGPTDGAGDSRYPCEKNVGAYTESFDSWWGLCEFTYAGFGITKQQFAGFPFSGGFKKGDLPVIQNDAGYKVGDIVVYNIPSSGVPIIHRIVKINSDGTYQTKGDHNSGQNPYEKSVQKSQIRGKVIFLVPYLGYLRVLIPIN